MGMVVSVELGMGRLKCWHKQRLWTSILITLTFSTSWNYSVSLRFIFHLEKCLYLFGSDTFGVLLFSWLLKVVLRWRLEFVPRLILILFDFSWFKCFSWLSSLIVCSCDQLKINYSLWIYFCLLWVFLKERDLEITEKVIKISSDIAML